MFWSQSLARAYLHKNLTSNLTNQNKQTNRHKDKRTNIETNELTDERTNKHRQNETTFLLLAISKGRVECSTGKHKKMKQLKTCQKQIMMKVVHYQKKTIVKVQREDVSNILHLEILMMPFSHFCLSEYLCFLFFSDFVFLFRSFVCNRGQQVMLELFFLEQRFWQNDQLWLKTLYSTLLHYLLFRLFVFQRFGCARKRIFDQTDR